MHSQFSIEKIKQGAEKNANSKSAKALAGEDVIIVLGPTGVGKSTFMHYLGDSELWKDNKTGDICFKSKPIMNHIVASHGLKSETKSIECINLNNPQINQKNKYKLKSDVFLVDSPGTNDTGDKDDIGGANTKIINGLTIVAPLQTARSVRVMILLSFNAILNERGGKQLCDILKSIANLIPNTNEHTHGIIYFFRSDHNDHTQNKNKLMIVINELLKDQVNFGYSDDVKSLLKDMKSKFNDGKNIPVFNPVGNKTFGSQLTPTAIVKMLMDLTPIMNPSQVFMPYVEESCKDTLGLKLTYLNKQFMAKFEYLNKVINREIDASEAKDARDTVRHELQEMSKILDQLRFINTYLPAHDTNKDFEVCQMAILKFSRSLIKTVHTIFNSLCYGKKMEEADMDLFKLILAMQSSFKNIWIDNVIGENTVNNLLYKAQGNIEELNLKLKVELDNCEKLAKRGGFSKKEIEEIKQRTIAAIENEWHENNKNKKIDLDAILKIDESLLQKTIISIALECHDILLGQLGKLQKFDEIRHNHLLLSQSIEFKQLIIDQTGNEEEIKSNLPLLKITQYPLVIERISGNAKENIESVNQRVQLELNELETECNSIDNASSLQNILCSLTSIQQFADTSREGEPSRDVDQIAYLKNHIHKLNKRYLASLNDHDFDTAAFVLNEIHEFNLSLDTIDEAINNKIDRPDIKEIKTTFLVTLIDLIPERVKENIVITDFSKNEIEQLIYLMHIYKLILTGLHVEKHFKDFKTEETGSVTSIYRHIEKQLKNSSSQLLTSISEQIKDESDIFTLVRFQSTLEQFWYLLSIPHSRANEVIKKDYHEALSKIKLFANDFRNHFVTELKSIDLSAESYSNIGRYIYYMNCSDWVQQLQFHDETTVKLITAINNRATVLTKYLKKVNETKVTQPVEWLDHALSANHAKMTLDYFDQYIIESEKVLLNEAYSIYSETCTEIYNKIKTISSCSFTQVTAEFKLLSPAEIKDNSEFIDQCKELNLFTDTIDGTINNFNSSIQLLVESRVSNVQERLDTLSNWQSVPDVNAHPSKQEISALVKEMTGNYEFIKGLKKALPKYQDNCNDQIVKYKNQLAVNYEQVSKTLSLALLERLSAMNDDDEAVVKFGLMIGLCEKIISLDKYLSDEMINEKKTYSTLFENYSKAVDENNRELYSKINKLIRAGDFDNAISEINQLPGQAKPFLSKQANAIIKNHINSVIKLSRQLEKSNAFKPEIMPEFMEKLGILAKANVLLEEGLLDSAILGECEQVVTSAQSAINTWYSNCLAVLHEYTANFNVGDFIKAAALLSKTVESMQTCPADHAELESSVLNAFDNKVNEVVNSFTLPFAQWIKTYGLDYIQNQLMHLKNATTWNSLSTNVHSSIELEISQLEKAIKANTIPLRDVIKSISTIETWVANLPDESTNLRENVISLCRNCLQEALLRMESNDLDFNSYLNNLCDFMKEKTKLKASLQGLKTKNLVNRLQTATNDSSQIIARTLENGKFAGPDFSHFIEIYEQVNGNSQFISADIACCQKALKSFTGELFKKISNNLTQYIQNNSFEDEGIEEITASLQLLTQLNQCRKNMSKEGKKLFDSLLPDTYYQNINSCFTKCAAILNENNEKFGKALGEKDSNALSNSLVSARDWNNVTSVLNQYISACDSQDIEPIPSLLKAIAVSHPESLSDQLKQDIASMIKRVTLNISKYLQDTPEKGEEERKAYYRRLVATMEFIVNCEKVANVNLSLYKQELLNNTQKYLEQLYQKAEKELPKKLEDKETWETFYNCAQELKLFADHSEGYQQHLGGIELNTCKALDAASLIDSQFHSKLNIEVEDIRQFIEAGIPIFDEKTRSGIINFAISLQKIVDTLPSKSEQVKKSLGELLVYIRESFGMNAFQLLMTELHTEDSGLGSAIINSQSCFKGMSTALRNTRTKAQDINYVLDGLEKKNNDEKIRPLTDNEKSILLENYKIFQSNYDRLLERYLKPEMKFSDNPELYYKQILQDMESIIQNDPVQKDMDGKIKWNTAAPKIPVMMAYLFVIWTLHDAKDYFDTSSSNDSINYLKKPHPGQVIGIFSMLNIAGNGSGLPSHLAQILSGEGKSIQLAIAAEILAKLGFAVSVACYSEYLSSRDYADFEWMFKLLDENIKYGTFTTLCEDILNEQGDLRQLTENVILDKNSISLNKKDQREIVILVDEVDVFFNKHFYGALYNPVLNFNRPEVSALIQLIWSSHKSGATLNLKKIQQTQEYLNCQTTWKLGALLDQSINKMLDDLDNYKSDDHKYIITKYGKIAYAYQDGSTSDVNMGYKTMWAYYHEFDKGNITSKDTLNDHTGLLINCGNFAYSEMLKAMGLFKCTLGVTGTLRELSEPEQALVRNEFSIGQQTFIPSVYGKNRLNFAKNAAVKVENNHFYDDGLIKVIMQRRKGSILVNENVRPVLVFFETQESLMKFYDCKALKESGIQVGVMTQRSSSTTQEQNAEIAKATSLGQVTLIVQEKGRGRDFFCHSPKIEANGGVDVIITFFADELSMETQLLYRTARQGQDGSASMVLREEDLIEKYELSISDIQIMRDNNNIYDCLHVKRIAKFAEVYGKLTDKMVGVREVLHVPSLQYWQQLSSPICTHDEVLLSLQKLNQATISTQVLQKSRTIILMDATGSMISVINGCKQMISHAVNDLLGIFVANQIAKDNMLLQLAIYRCYSSTPSTIFAHSPWSNDANVLQNFINNINAESGFSSYTGCESMEVGLEHARLESEKDGVTQVIVITDAGAADLSDLNRVRQGNNGTHQEQFYYNCADAFTLAEKFGKTNVPIFTFFVETGLSKKYPKIKPGLQQLADLSGGAAEEIDINSANANEQLSKIVGKQVILSVSKNDEQREKMLREYAEKSNNRPTQ